MPSVLTVAEARAAGCGAGLADEPLQLAIDDIESEIVRRFGPYSPTASPVTVVEVFPNGVAGSLPLTLRRRVASIVSITEYLAHAGSPVPTRVLDATDFRVRGYLLDRLSSGPNPARGWSEWGLEVAYIPIDDVASRKQATIDVLKVELAHSGFTSRRIGDYSEATSAGAAGEDVSTARSKILRRLRPKKLVMA